MRHNPMKHQFSSVSVAIPTKNRPEDLEVSVRGVFEQTVLPTKLIIVDQSADDRSRLRVIRLYDALPVEVCRRVGLVYIHDASLTGLTAARNHAMKAVKTEMVLFLDDDVVLEPNYIEQVLTVYRLHPQAIGVSGVVTNYTAPPSAFRIWAALFMRGPFHDDRQPVYWAADQLRTQGAVRVTRLGGGLMSFRTVAIAGKAFDENMHGACDGEDIEFCAQLYPAELYITAAARLVHKQTPVARHSEHWMTKQARTMWYLYRKNWDHGLFNRVCFVWLNCGYVFSATVASLFHLSFTSWKELFRAIRESRAMARALATERVIAVSDLVLK